MLKTLNNRFSTNQIFKLIFCYEPNPMLHYLWNYALCTSTLFLSTALIMFRLSLRTFLPIHKNGQKLYENVSRAIDGILIWSINRSSNFIVKTFRRLIHSNKLNFERYKKKNVNREQASNVTSEKRNQFWNGLS